jgi:hypothetical protein
MWYLTGNINGSIFIEPGSSMVLNGSLTVVGESIISIGSSSSFHIYGCAQITGTVQAAYSPTYGSKSTVKYPSGCSEVRVPLSIASSSTGTDACTQVSATSSENSPGTLNVLFNLSPSNSCKRKQSKVLVIVLPAVFGGIVVILLLLVLLATFNSTGKATFRPFWVRKVARQGP